MQVIKAKYKLEDVVRINLCLPQAERRQCRHINEAALAGEGYPLPAPGREKAVQAYQRGCTRRSLYSTMYIPC